ncbi:two-component sensor histidine kinase, partial [Streptomyces griseorubens]
GQADGTVCLFPSSVGTVKGTASDREGIENAGTGSRGIFRDGTAEDGDDVRVLTLPLVINDPSTLTSTHAAVIVAVPLTGTQSTLNDLALILLLVYGIGVLGSAAAGLAVARTGLRPVDKLTEAVEHVARTEDLG